MFFNIDVGMKIRVLFYNVFIVFAVFMWQGYGKLAYGQSQTITLTIAAASDLQRVLDDIRYKFEYQYPNIRLQFVFASSGNLASQIEQRAPYDLFLSADEWCPHQLQKLHLANVDGPFVYTIGRLTLWVRKDLYLNLEREKWDVLLNKKISTIVIANPNVAPYGRAAESALKNMHIYHQVKAKLIFADSIAHAAQMLHMGTVDAGIISHSQANSLLLLHNGVVWDIPDINHEPIRQAGIVINSSIHIDESKIFKDFLINHAGQIIFKKHGFGKI